MFVRGTAGDYDLLFEMRWHMDIKKAEEFYKQYNGMEFHMCREDQIKYQQFCALGISDTIKEQWKCEMWNQYYEQFPYDDMEKAIFMFRTMRDCMLKRRNFFEKMREIVKRCETLVNSKQASYFAKSITGNNSSKGHGGLIELCCKGECYDMAQDMVEIALRLIEKAAQDSKVSLLSVRKYLVDVCELYDLSLLGATKEQLMQADDEERFNYYYEGAYNGNGFSMGELGKCYRDGIGCEVDLKLAKNWMERAYEKGNKMIYPHLQELQESIGKQDNK